MKKSILLLSACCLSLCVSATQYSKLSVITAAKASGRWNALKAWISASGLEDEFQNCAYLSDDYPQFAAITNAIASSGAATSSEISAILSASMDPAVADSLVRRVYDADMATDKGRVKWHGAVTNVIFDTNALVKVQIHADGFVYHQAFRSMSAMGIDERISAAARKARAEAATKARAEAKRKSDRIADLQTNLVSEVSKLMAQRKWPEELARLYLLHELNTLVGTVEVSAEVVPQPVE